MSDDEIAKHPFVRAAFINAIREEGSKEEACDFLQQEWNKSCALSDKVAKLEVRNSELEREAQLIREKALREAAEKAKGLADELRASSFAGSVAAETIHLQILSLIPQEKAS